MRLIGKIDKRSSFLGSPIFKINRDQYRYMWVVTTARDACSLRGVTEDLLYCNSVTARPIVFNFGTSLDPLAMHFEHVTGGI